MVAFKKGSGNPITTFSPLTSLKVTPIHWTIEDLWPFEKATFKPKAAMVCNIRLIALLRSSNGPWKYHIGSHLSKSDGCRSLPL